MTATCCRFCLTDILQRDFSKPQKDIRLKAAEGGPPFSKHLKINKNFPFHRIFPPSCFSPIFWAWEFLYSLCLACECSLVHYNI